MTETFVVLRVIGLSGQAEIAAVARGSGLSADAAGVIVRDAEASDLVVSGPRGYRLTADGRAQVADALAAERAGLDPAVTLELYERFGGIDRKFKELVTEYQLSDAPTRFSWAVAGMTDVHPAVQELVARAVELGAAPRAVSRRGSTPRWSTCSAATRSTSCR